MEKTDFQLIQILKHIRTSREEDSFVEKYARSSDRMQFHEYLQQYLIANGVPMATAMNNSRLNKNYGYNIVNGTRRKPGRDKVLALCIGAGMTFDEVQKSLELAGKPLLNPRDERDVRISVAVNNQIRDVLKLNIKLEEKGLEPLKV